MKAVYCPLLRRSDQAQRQDLIGVPAVEVHGLRRVDDGEVRRHGDKARGVPRVAPLEGLAGHDAGRRALLQAQDGRVLGGLAHARPRRRAPPRALRRRDLGRARPRGSHMLQRHGPRCARDGTPGRSPRRSTSTGSAGSAEGRFWRLRGHSLLNRNNTVH